MKINILQLGEIKILKLGKVKKRKKAIKVNCKACHSKLQIKRRHLRRNPHVQIATPGLGYYRFKCPACKTLNNTTVEQEQKLGLSVKNKK